LLVLDDAAPSGQGISPDQEAANARSCLTGGDTLGYIGPLNSGDATISEPILNAGAMAMISPANTDPALTSPRTRSRLEPATAAGRLDHVTYFRTVTTDALDGPASAVFLRNHLHVTTYALVDDGEIFGLNQARSMDAYAHRHAGLKRLLSARIDTTDPASQQQSADGIADRILSARPGAVYCGCDDDPGSVLVKTLRSRGYAGPVVDSNASYGDQQWIDATGAAARNTYVAFAGLDRLHSARAFRQAYARTYHVPLELYDAQAYDAATALLAAIEAAARAGKLSGSRRAMRSGVVDALIRTHLRGVTGPISFDRNGDTTNLDEAIYTVQHGTWVFAATVSRIPGAAPTG
jgi:branched-chain amino acid transport system substrate-binding protein